MAVRIHAPNGHHTGEVVGVVFDRGQAEVDELTPTQREYFRSQGYGIDRLAARVTEARPQFPLKTQLGSVLQDAAQGELARVTVLVDGAVVYDGQHDAGEVAEFVQVASERQPVVELPDVEPLPEGPAQPAAVERPKVRDSINAWREYRLTQGHDPDEVAEATKDELQQLPDTPASKED